MGVILWEYAARGNKSKGVMVGTLDLYFSYQTIIAFRDGDTTTITQNTWNTTTGGHLNSIDGGSKKAKAERLPSNVFEQKLAEMLKKHNLS